MNDWVSLFSGGKDSSWALYRALEEGLDVSRLLTVHPAGDSYMYHTPATELASLAAESVDDAGAQGDAELEPMEAALRELAAGDDLDLAGVTAGAVESEFQTNRIRAMCDRLGIDLFAPLWQRDPVELAEAMFDAGFEIRIVQVAAYGLDESWLGRRFDAAALDDLLALREEYGVHPLGEGGEFETYVVDGPHMDRRIDLTYDAVWEGDRGHVEIRDARLE
jgi:ABC transporter with metal-binding/Fe-S-binding domain ATP-binding protein